MVLWRRAKRANDPITFDQWLTYLGNVYPLQLTSTLSPHSEDVGAGFMGYTYGAYMGSAVVFACMDVRRRLFSQARFAYQRYSNGRPGDLFVTPELRLLEHPWPSGTTADLLAVAITDVDLAGNAFLTRVGDQVRRLRPDWVSIVLGVRGDPSVVAGDLEAEVVGYLYTPGGPGSGREVVTLYPENVCHYAPIPDPTASFRGMSWLTPVITEVAADKSATTHKKKFFDNGATPNMIVKLDAAIGQEAFRDWVKLFEEHHEGAANAYKTLFLGGGADATVVGANFQQLDFKATQGTGETRIAAAAGVHPTIVGLSEGLQGSSLNAGNFAAARRLVADGLLHSLWASFSGSLERLVTVPAGAHIAADTRDVPFLREDAKDVAQIEQTDAGTIRTLIEAGFLADTVVDAVLSGDYKRLKHSGLFSVQLQAPGSTKMPLGEVPGELPVGGTGGTAPEEATPSSMPMGNGKAPASAP